MQRSARTQTALQRLVGAATRHNVESLLDEAPALPGPSVVESLERAHFAVIKLVLEGQMPFDGIAQLYRRDARDLWVCAGFADDARAHEAWWTRLIAPSD